MKKLILAATVLAVGFAGQAAAASRAENTGVASGAIAGALAGGPVGLIIGAAIGGHYASVVERGKVEAARADNLDDDLSMAHERIDATRGQVSTLTSELTRSRNEVGELGAEIGQLVRDQALLTELRFEVLFRTNASELGEADTAQIALLAKFLKRHPELRVRLHGHTDIRGGEGFNDELSQARASAVAGLLTTMDIDESRVEMLAYGEREARAGEGDLDGFALDRRVSVEFDVIDKESPTVARRD